MQSRSSNVAEQYARAFLEVLAGLPERERLQCEAELAAASGVLQRTPELERFLRNPVVDRKRKGDLLARAAPGAHELTRRFLDLLVARGRADRLPEIHSAYERLRDESRQVLVAEVTSALPLGGEAARRCEEALHEASGREVRLSLVQDPSLIGGLRTRVGSRVYDSSVRARLDLLRRRLAGG